MFGPAARAPLATSVALLLLVSACEEEAEPEAAGCLVNCADASSAPQLDGSTWPDAGALPMDSGSSSDGATAASTLPCEIKTIVDSKCAQCHGEPPNFGAYMALASHAHFHAAGTTDKSKKYYELTKTRVNLPATDGRHMPPPTSPQLTLAELATFNGWLDQGAPAGNGCSSSGSDGDAATGDAGVVDTSGLTCYKLLARGTDMKSPFKVGVANDAYYNVRFAAPWQGTVYGIVIRPVIDNSKVIHHWLLFQDNSTGTPTGADKNGVASGAHPDGQLLAGWAPGSDPINFRAAGVDVGIELPATSYTVEFHYNSSDASAVDASGVEICVDTKKPANVAALSWLGYDNAPIANGSPFETPKTTWTGKCDPVSKEPINILSVWPHMHLQGRRMKATINRKNGTKELLHDEPFNFEYQRSYDKKVTLMDGDTITTECTYAVPSEFGKETDREMCYLFTLAYPKGALADNGFWGRTAHGGSACLGQ